MANDKENIGLELMFENSTYYDKKEKHVKYIKLISTFSTHMYVTMGIEGLNFLISDKFTTSL